MRIAIFVDGANLYYTQRDMGWTVDLKALVSYFNQIGQVVDAYYYTGLKQPITAQKKKFLANLPQYGYVAVTKNGKILSSGFKANLDIEIVLDIFNTIDTYDMAILVSGDGDFERALQYLRVRGKLFYIVSTKNSVAKELLAVCGMHYIDLADIKEYVMHHQISGLTQQDDSYLDDFPPEAENE